MAGLQPETLAEAGSPAVQEAIQDTTGETTEASRRETASAAAEAQGDAPAPPVLVIEPSRLFQRYIGLGRWASLCQWANLLWTYRLALALALVANLVASAFEGSTLVLLTLAVNLLVGATPELGDGASWSAAIWRWVQGLGDPFLVLLALAVGTQWLRAALQIGGRAAAAHIQASVEAELRGRLFRRFVHMGYLQAGRHKIGDMLSYIHQAETVGNLINSANQFAYIVCNILVYLGVLLWLSWPATLAALGVLALLTPLLRLALVRVRRMARRFVQATVGASEQIGEYIQGLRLVLSFGRTEAAIRQVDGLLEEARRHRRRGLILAAAISPGVESILILGIALFLGLGYLLIPRGQMDAGLLARASVFAFVLYRLLPRFSALNSILARLHDQWPVSQRVLAAVQARSAPPRRDGSRIFGGLRQGVAFRQVSYRYADPEPPAVAGLSFDLPRGSFTALVGASGAGKSTVINLLLGLCDPDQGQILVDGVDLREYRVDSWRERLGVVEQNVFLFHATIRDNIAFGRPEATQAEIVAAARAAQIHDFILTLPQGYDTVVGERGVRLSGGQRQRVAIARALLRNPDLLILDEATSELDSESERRIQAALAAIRRDRTLLVVAHRLSTVTQADQILVLDQGRLVEQGTHQELLARDGYYARFWRLQAQSDRTPTPSQTPLPDLAP